MFSMQLPRCEVEGRIDSSCRSRCHFSRRQPSVLIQLALNAVDVEPASSGGSGLNRLLIFLVLALRPLCAHQAAPNSDAFAHSNDARHAFCLVRAMHWRPARSTHGKAKSTRYFCVYNRGGLYLLLVGTVGTAGSLPSLLLRYKSRA